MHNGEVRCLLLIYDSASGAPTALAKFLICLGDHSLTSVLAQSMIIDGMIDYSTG